MEFTFIEISDERIDVRNRRNELELTYAKWRQPGAIRAPGRRLQLPEGHRFFVRSTVAGGDVSESR